jgi:hypothetical protein
MPLVRIIARSERDALTDEGNRGKRELRERRGSMTSPESKKPIRVMSQPGIRMSRTHATAFRSRCVREPGRTKDTRKQRLVTVRKRAMRSPVQGRVPPQSITETGIMQRTPQRERERMIGENWPNVSNSKKLLQSAASSA